jgi:hypothetical protein
LVGDRSGKHRGVSGIVSIAIGVVVLLGAVLLYRRRDDPTTQRTAGITRGMTGLTSRAPRSPRKLTVDAVLAVILGVALIVYGVASL